MAQVMRGRVGPYSRKLVRIVAPRFDLPGKYQRSCFHTSWILQVEGQRVLMPSLSPTMETGTIVKWMKKEGDTIAPGDVLADIQTDKAIVAMEMEDESVLAKIIIPEGSKDVKVGTLIALTVEAGEDWKSVEIPADVPAQGAAQQTAPSPPAAATVVATSPAAAAPAESAPEYQHNITMPSLSPTMTTGTIVKWVKKEGDTIQPGDVIADIQTDKAVMSFEIEDEAVLAKIILPEGSVVEVGELIAITVESGEDWKNVVVPAATAATPAAPTAPKPPAVSAPAGASPPSSGQVYGLAVKRLLEEYNLSSGSIKGTGRPNRILKSDVLSYIEEKQLQKVAPKSAPPPAAPKGATVRSPSPPPKGGKAPKVEPSKYQDLPISNIRNVIAKRLAESKRTIPHSYAYIDIQMDKLNEMREKLKNEKINVSVNDFITKAVAHALLECPDINTLYQNDKIVHAQKVDICIAVSTPTGLITPIVVDAPTKSLVEISAKIKELAGKARDGKLKPEEFQGGSFTISNLGMFGIKEFCAIINPPQSAILAVGGGRQEIDCCLKPSTKMTAALSYDRRAVDEDQAADFLAVLRAMLEDPTFLAVGRAQAHRHRRA